MDLKNQHEERVAGIIERITFHNPENGWTVLKLSPHGQAKELVSVLIHQAKVFAGATVECYGHWQANEKYGEQFQATRIVEKKPATTAALEKYLGSGLIKGVGPKIAKRIVKHFQDECLEIFENSIDKLMEIPGIAEKKLLAISHSWKEHQAIRNVMMFLQEHGISTLLAVKIYKFYGDNAVQKISENPYRLAKDIYGIGFFSADRVALSMGVAENSQQRLQAAILHVLDASREMGHCYLFENQIIAQVTELLDIDNMQSTILEQISLMQTQRNIRFRVLEEQRCYYSNALFRAENQVAERIVSLLKNPKSLDLDRTETWIRKYSMKKGLQLSEEQHKSVLGIANASLSVLTGGPGCGKTTTTQVIAHLFNAMGKKVVLAAPTGRAAQRMSEVIGLEAKTIHRLLEWLPSEGGFKRNSENPLNAEVIVIDESSMLDITLGSSLLQAIPEGCQVLFIGDADQLPAVGAGRVLGDLIATDGIPVFRLSEVFRQARQSSIIRFAHQLNHGETPKIPSAVSTPKIWGVSGADCLFFDADEATQDQIKFLNRAKNVFQKINKDKVGYKVQRGSQWTLLHKQEGEEALEELMVPKDVDPESIKQPVFNVPEKFKKTNLLQLAESPSDLEALGHLFKNIHPWSTLHFGLTGLQTVVHLYCKTIPQRMGNCEIQVLAPQIRGTLGTLRLNQSLQEAVNPKQLGQSQIQLGERIFRIGDRVIQKRNNYDLDVFNGDIGKITNLDTEEICIEVEFCHSNVRKQVIYQKQDLNEVALAYAITVHKSQGSEFDVVIMPIFGQHFNMLFRNLIYTGLTRAKKYALLVGSRKAFAMAIGKTDTLARQSALQHLLTHGLYSS